MEFGNNYGVNYGQPTFGATGYQWNPNAQQQVKQMNILTADEIQTLMKSENKFTLALTQTEKLKAACNHRKADGTGDTLVENADGTVSCQICGYTFKPVDPATSGEEYLAAAVAEIVDILQTIKMLWIDVDPQVMREYTQIIPLIEKIPQLYNIAAKNYSNHENYNAWSYNSKNMSTLQAFQMLSGLLNNVGQPNAMQFGSAPQPQPAPAPGFYQQGVAGNPFGYGYGSPVYGPYQPQTSGYAYHPEMAAPQQTVVLSTTDQTTTESAPAEGETVTTATFKA